MKDILKTGVGNETVEIDVSETLRHSNAIRYEIQYVVRNSSGAITTPTAGTIAVAGKLYANGVNTAIVAAQDLHTNRDNWLESITGAYHTLEFTVASLDADHTVDIFIRPVTA